MPELLAIGGAYVDINCPNFPFDDTGLQPETEVIGGEYILDAGGSAPNFARLCSALELPTTFIGKVGEDEMGRIFGDLLRASGVEPALIVDPNVQTNIGTNLINTSGVSIMSVVGNANQSLGAEEVKAKAEALLDTVSYLCIGGCFKLKTLLPAFAELTTIARSKAVKIALDHGRVTSDVTPEEIETVRQLALEVDYYFPSSGEFMQLWEVGSIEEGLQLMQAKARGVVVLKDGEHGAVTMIDNQIVHIPAFDVKPLHTVGAGDSFNAGFITAQYHGMDLPASIRFACATAALKISQKTLPDLAAVQELGHE